MLISSRMRPRAGSVMVRLKSVPESVTFTISVSRYIARRPRRRRWIRPCCSSCLRSVGNHRSSTRSALANPLTVRSPAIRLAMISRRTPTARTRSSSRPDWSGKAAASAGLRGTIIRHPLMPPNGRLPVRTVTRRIQATRYPRCDSYNMYEITMRSVSLNRGDYGK